MIVELTSETNPASIVQSDGQTYYLCYLREHERARITVDFLTIDEIDEKIKS